MSKFLIDTDVLIEILRGNQKIISRMESLHNEGNAFFYSPVAKAEIFHGIRKGEEENVNSLFQSMQSVPITDETGEMAGLYLKQFHFSHNLQMGDALIAATANLTEAVLITCNRKHYPMKNITVITP